MVPAAALKASAISFVATAQHHPSIRIRAQLPDMPIMSGKTVNRDHPALQPGQAEQSGIAAGNRHHRLRARQSGEIGNFQREAGGADAHDQQMHQLLRALDARLLEGQVERTFQLLEIQRFDVFRSS